MLQFLCVGVIIIIAAIDNQGSIVRSESLPFCGYTPKTSTCPGDALQVEIQYPFWIENHTVDDTGKDCISHSGFQIKCAANGRPVINISSNFYYVRSIFRSGLSPVSLRIEDESMDAQECPHPRRNITARFLSYMQGTVNMTFLYNCSRYPQNVVQHIPCLDYDNNTSTSRSFAFLDQEIKSHQFDWYANCEEAVVVPVMYNYIDTTEAEMNYTRAYVEGIGVEFGFPVNCRNCELSGGRCWTNETTIPIHCRCQEFYAMEDSICVGQYFNTYYYGNDNKDGASFSIEEKIAIGVSIGIGILLLSLLAFYRKKCYSLCTSIASSCRKKIKGPTKVELFLDNNREVISSHSYTYANIKKMTNSFKDILGQGGYGSVFKGKLRNGRLVAVKVLNESKGNGDDFINEVATIGRTNHVNVVSLLGFCAEGTKRALVYEFMPNGSLEKFIHNAKDSGTTSSLLGWEKVYQITLGIARGLEYLHRGCNTRILHFDIKPHNILLDKYFCPKISDFGLAKLCMTRENLVSLDGTRGTPGYIAPEVYFRNFGGVSHKSDVYSYGMMVFEMIGGRKNMNFVIESTSQIYFPQWIYKCLKGNFEVGELEEIEATIVAGEVFKLEIVRKMIIVALWCIQAHPGDRPSMTKVIDMLEGNMENLQFPPNPFLDPCSTTSSLS